MTSQNGMNIFPLAMPTTPLAPEFLQDTIVQLLELINSQCAASSGGSASGGFTVSGGLFLAGSTSGTTELVPASTASGVITVPSATDTMVLLAATQTLTNKTLSGVNISSVAAAQTGTFTANGTTAVTVSNTSVTANSAIIPTLKTVGGTVGATPYVATITPGTGFTVVATASNTSVYNYTIVG